MEIKVIDKRDYTNTPKGYLSTRELEVLQGIVEGKRNQEIHHQYGINVSNVSIIRGRLITKLGLIKENNSLMIVLAAIKYGYLPKNTFNILLNNLSQTKTITRTKLIMANQEIPVTKESKKEWLEWIEEQSNKTNDANPHSTDTNRVFLTDEDDIDIAKFILNKFKATINSL